MGYMDALGRQLSLREKMAQELEGHDDALLLDASQELQQRQFSRMGPSGFGLYTSPGSEDYFRRQGHEQDAAFLRSVLQTGERPRTRVGYAEDEHAALPEENWAVRRHRGADLVAQDKARESSELQNLLMEQRLRQQGFA